MNSPAEGSWCSCSALRALHGRLAVRTDSVAAEYLCNVAALVAGVLAFLAIEYGSLRQITTCSRSSRPMPCE